MGKTKKLVLVPKIKKNALPTMDDAGPSQKPDEEENVDDPPEMEAESVASLLNSPNKLPKGIPYSRKEDEEMVAYVTKDKLFFLEANNMYFWVEASKCKVCPGRSPASLHERWRKISCWLSEFSVDPKLALQVKKYSRATIVGRREMRDQLLGVQLPDRGPLYTRKEDKAIMRFMNESRSHDRLRNNLELWCLAEKQKICPQRSATSMMIRYRKLRNPCRRRRDTENKFKRVKRKSSGSETSSENEDRNQSDPKSSLENNESSSSSSEPNEPPQLGKRLRSQNGPSPSSSKIDNASLFKKYGLKHAVVKLTPLPSMNAENTYIIQSNNNSNQLAKKRTTGRSNLQLRGWLREMAKARTNEESEDSSSESTYSDATSSSSSI